MVIGKYAYDKIGNPSNFLSTGILLIHLQPISHMARLAAEGTISNANHGVQIQLVVAAAAGLMALLVATGLAVYKPRGMTVYGLRKQFAQRDELSPRDPSK